EDSKDHQNILQPIPHLSPPMREDGMKELVAAMTSSSSMPFSMDTKDVAMDQVLTVIPVVAVVSVNTSSNIVTPKV
ncbi:hypothetical protein KI387_001913, partial [Taxus chinensis]